MPARVHLELAVRNLLSFASQFGDFQFGADVGLSDDPMEACWQLAGILPIGEMDRFDLLSAQSAEDLIAQTYEIVTTADDTLRAMMANDDEPPTPTEFS
jgi:hypothetical protein